MLYCNECGNELSEKLQFCSECGASSQQSTQPISVAIANMPHADVNRFSNHSDDSEAIEYGQSSAGHLDAYVAVGAITNPLPQAESEATARRQGATQTPTYGPVIALIVVVGTIAIIIAIVAASSISKPPPPVVTAPAIRYVVIIAINANVRVQPSTKAESIAIVSNNTRLQFVGTSNGWFQVRLADGRTGFISANVARGE